MQLLTRYLFKQLVLSTLAISFVLTFIIWLTQSLRLLELIVNGGAPLNLFGMLLVLTVPKFLEIIMPIALAISILFVYNKLTMDSEIVVMQSVGTSYKRLVQPAILTAVLVAMIVFGMSGWLTPLANRELDRLKDVIKSDFSTVLLREGVFNTIGNDTTIYISDRKGTANLSGIMIHSTRDKDAPPTTILAERGGVITRDNKPFVVVYEGMRQQFNPKSGVVETLSFDEYSLDISALDKRAINPWVDADERILPDLFVTAHSSELKPKLAQQFIAEAHNRITRPFLAIALSLIAIACLLSGQFNRRGQTRKIITAVILLILVQGANLGLVNYAGQSFAGVIGLYVIALVPPFLAYQVLSAQDRAGNSLFKKLKPKKVAA